MRQVRRQPFPPPRWAASPIAAVGLLATALLPSCLAFWILWIAPIDAAGTDRAAMAARDFSDLWAAGHLATAHAFAVLYHPVELTAFLRDTFGPGMPNQIWPYPPTTLLLAALIAPVPILLGFIVYTAAGLMLLWWAIRHCLHSRAAGLAILLSPAVAENLLAGQNGALTAAAIIGGLLCIETRPRVAGIFLGLLILKPQMGMLLPICLIAGRRWQVLLTSAMTALAIVAASALIFGVQVWTDFMLLSRPAITAYFEAPWTGTESQRTFVSVFMAARALGADLPVAYGVQALTALLAAGLVWKVWRPGRENAVRRLPVTLIATVTASPWIHGYDMPVVAVAIVLMLPAARHRDRLLMAVAWLWPGVLSLVALPAIIPTVSLLSMLMVASQLNLAIADQGGKNRVQCA